MQSGNCLVSFSRRSPRLACVDSARQWTTARACPSRTPTRDSLTDRFDQLSGLVADTASYFRDADSWFRAQITMNEGIKIRHRHKNGYALSPRTSSELNLTLHRCHIPAPCATRTRSDARAGAE